MTGAVLAAVVMLAAGGSPEVASEWKDLAPLLGDWTAVGTGKPGEGTGGFTLTPDAGGKVLVRREPGPGPPFRLTYDWSDAQTLKVRFEIAAPNAPDKFNTYLEGAAKRKQP